MNAAARGAANYDRRRGVPQIMSFGHEVGDLVERANDEINELHLGDGAETQVAHAARCADDGRFADRRIDHPLPAEFFQQAFAGLERSAVHADIFADQYYGRIAFHLFVHGLLDGLKKCDLCGGGGFDAGFFRCGGHYYLRAFLAGEFLPALADLVAFFLLTALWFAGFVPFDLTVRGFSCAASMVSATASGTSVSVLPPTSFFWVSPK